MVSAFRQTLLAPIPMMLLGTVLALTLVGLATLLALSGPWLGLQLGYDEDQQLPYIEALHLPDLEANLQPGDRLAYLRSPDNGRTVSLRGFEPHVEPPSHARFADHNALLAREGEIAGLMEGPTLLIGTADGREVPVTVWPERPLSSLHYQFWLFNLFGLIAWTIGLAALAIRPQETAARLLCLSGAGFFMATFFNSIYKVRELALPQELFHAYSRANHFGLAVMLFALLALMAYFPRRITRLAPGYYLLPLMLLYQANETWQWLQWPFHAYYLPILALYVVGIMVATYQWRISVRHPLDRAALKWMLLSIFIIMGLGLAMYFLPIALFGQGVFPQWAMVGTASLLYLGFAFGIVRYRLFDVERWWLRLWGWFLGGLSVVLFDLALVAFLNIQPMIALGIAVIAVGWIYFPLRQLVWRKLTPGRQSHELQLVEQVERIAQSLPGQHTDAFWIRLLEDAFQPTDVSISNQPKNKVELLDNGARISVPLLSGEGALQMAYPNRGRRLFSREDIRYLESLLRISYRILAVHRAEIQAVQRERERIVRDLHDDVGGHLMTLLRRAPSEDFENQARKAIKALRETMRVLDGNPLQDLAVILGDLRADVEERLSGTGISLCWNQELTDESLEITMRQAINVSRIIAEAVSNALNHAEAEFIAIDVTADENNISLRVRNDGVRQGRQDARVLRGRGLNNMTVRARELGGSLAFALNEQEARLAAIIPV
ncbi:MAG: hypothetical protein LAT63_08170 [Marinobacter sp.]|nr:hypothetical protein [Marinobacter sp.]